MYCPNCSQEIIPYSVSRGAASDEELERLRQQARQQGKLLLFNPSPLGPWRCPACRGLLERSSPSTTKPKAPKK